MATPIDILIIGAGLVGNSLALALAGKANVAIIEANPLDAPSKSDERALALSFSTQRILSALDVWKVLQPHTTPIQHIHVSEAKRFGATRFAAADYHVDALGHTITAQTLTDVLRDTAINNSSITHFYSSKLQKLTPTPDGYRVEVQTPDGIHTFNTRLLVAADGAHSATRQLLGISAKQVPLSQIALTARMTLSRSHNYTAYERFADQAVLAALPMKNNEIAIVWTADAEQAETLKALPDAAFCEAFQTAFGYRLGKLAQVEKRLAYPIFSLEAAEQIRPHAVLLGNAAHTLHPVAAQGFNLSLRDVAMLAQIIRDAVATTKNPGDLSVLTNYLDHRKKGQRQIMGLTQVLTQSFSKKTLPWMVLKKMGLLGLEMLPFAKGLLAKQAMGSADEMPGWVLEKQN